MRIAVLSDIHANLPALEAVLAALGPVDAVCDAIYNENAGADQSVSLHDVLLCHA